MEKIAKVLMAQGNWDEALRFLQDEVLPACKQLGDAWEWVITQSLIADALQVRGQWDEALRIRQEEELPTYERLGDEAISFWLRLRYALTLLRRNAPGDRDEAIRLLLLALEDARAMRIPEEGQIEAILQAIG